MPMVESTRKSSLWARPVFLMPRCPSRVEKLQSVAFAQHVAPNFRMIDLSKYAAPSANTNSFTVCRGRRTMATKMTMPIWRSCCSCVSRAAADASVSARHHGAEFLLYLP